MRLSTILQLTISVATLINIPSYCFYSDYYYQQEENNRREREDYYRRQQEEERHNREMRDQIERDNAWRENMRRQQEETERKNREYIEQQERYNEQIRKENEKKKELERQRLEKEEKEKKEKQEKLERQRIENEKQEELRRQKIEYEKEKELESQRIKLENEEYEKLERKKSEYTKKEDSKIFNNNSCEEYPLEIITKESHPNLYYFYLCGLKLDKKIDPTNNQESEYTEYTKKRIPLKEKLTELSNYYDKLLKNNEKNKLTEVDQDQRNAFKRFKIKSLAYAIELNDIEIADLFENCLKIESIIADYCD